MDEAYGTCDNGGTADSNSSDDGRNEEPGDSISTSDVGWRCGTTISNEDDDDLVVVA